MRSERSNIGPGEYLSLNLGIPIQIMHLLTALDFWIRWERVESQGSLASTSFLLVPPERMKRDKMLVVSLPRTRN